MAQRATSLGPKPSVFIFVFLFWFFSVAFSLFAFKLNRKTLFFPLKKAIFVYLSVFPFVSL